MKAASATSLKTINSSKRMGDLKRNDNINDFILEVEEVFERLAPLPITYDIRPIQKEYFSEFTYHDVMGGLILSTLNEEVNARVVESSLADTKSPRLLKSQLLTLPQDKYSLSKSDGTEYPKTVIFWQGSNIHGIENQELIHKIMFLDETVMIKPHPITTEEGLRQLANQYGWHRIIDPNLSGFQFLEHCELACTPCNSEIGLIAAIKKIPCIDTTSIFKNRNLSYSPIYRLLEDQNVDHNYTIVASLMNSYTSGWIPPWADNIEERVEMYLERSMEIRSFFRPAYSTFPQTFVRSK